MNTIYTAVGVAEVQHNSIFPQPQIENNVQIILKT